MTLLYYFIAVCFYSPPTLSSIRGECPPLLPTVTQCISQIDRDESGEWTLYVNSIQLFSVLLAAKPT